MGSIIYPGRNDLEKKYDDLYPVHFKVLEEFGRRIEEELEKSRVRSSVKLRVKSFSSYYEKLLRRMSEEAENSVRKTGENPGSTVPPPIHDILGIRIVCPFLENLRQAEEVLRSGYRLREVEWKGADHSFKEFGYQSVHLLVELPVDLKKRYPHMEAEVCEVQIRTILQDAWAEVEHELVYKADFTPFDEPLRRKLAALNANLSLSDIIFQEIRDYQRQLHGELEQRRISFINRVEKEKPGFIPSGETSRAMNINGVNKNGGLPVAFTGSVDELLLEALHAHNNGNFLRAIQHYNAIFEQNIENSIKAVILVHRGMAFFGEARYEEALDDFLSASKLEPKNSKLFYYLGIVYRVMDNTSGAITAFQKSVQINPFNFESLFGLAQTFFEAGDFPASLEYCEKALKIVPESSVVAGFRRHVTGRMKL